VILPQWNFGGILKIAPIFSKDHFAPHVFKKNKECFFLENLPPGGVPFDTLTCSNRLEIIYSSFGMIATNYTANVLWVLVLALIPCVTSYGRGLDPVDVHISSESTRAIIKVDIESAIISNSLVNSNADARQTAMSRDFDLYLDDCGNCAYGWKISDVYSGMGTFQVSEYFLV
jgi:hypothetical protein